MSFLSSSKSEERPSTLANIDTPFRRPPSRRSQRPIPSPLKAATLFLGFIPLPPLLSVIYAAVGHSVLTATNRVSTPLETSVRSAAVGGAILTLPLAVLLYLLLFPTKPPAPEDFFEDEEDMQEPWSTYATYSLLVTLGLTLSAIATPLGAVCLTSSLTSTKAAEVGIVGGVIVTAGICLLCLAVFAIWWDLMRPKPVEGDL